MVYKMYDGRKITIHVMDENIDISVLSQRFVTWMYDHNYRRNPFAANKDKVINNLIDLSLSDPVRQSLTVTCYTDIMYYHIRKVWVDHRNIKPILHSKFGDNPDLLDTTTITTMRYRGPSASSNINEFHKSYTKLKSDLTVSMGPEYENWHIFYGALVRRYIAFRTVDYKVQFQLSNYGNNN